MTVADFLVPPPGGADRVIGSEVFGTGRVGADPTTSLFKDLLPAPTEMMEW